MCWWVWFGCGSALPTSLPLLGETVVLYAHGERWLACRRLMAERSWPLTLWIFVLPPTIRQGPREPRVP